MNALSVGASQALALALGAALVANIVARGAGAAAAVAGYGFALGSIAITLLLKLWSIAGFAWSFGAIATAAGTIALVAGIRARKVWSHPGNVIAAAEESAWRRHLVIALWMLIAAHVLGALIEAWLRPLFPWDAAAQWATKARVWFEYGRLVPFVDDTTWIAAKGEVFTDAHPEYPGTIPLLQVWAALALGSFDDAVVNIAWPLFLAALAVGTYGQLRRLTFAPLPAVATAYAVTSLPFVDVHAGLAGYADLAVAVLYAFAFLAFAVWNRERSPRNLVLLIACAVALPLLKVPGWLWMATLALGMIAVWLPRRAVGYLLALSAAVLFALMAYTARIGPISILGYVIAPQSPGPGKALLANLFFFANWHLLAYLLPVAWIMARRAIVAPALLPLTVTAGAAMVMLVFVFYFSSANVEGVGTYTTVNRALLHVVPALIVFTALAIRDAWQMHALARSSAAPVAA